ncbi:MAG: sulfatase [Kiritimatiellaeota bacterium]|nr:sulfatase [Kiritimatiellota bacterium]
MTDSGPTNADATTRPNVIWILGDEHRAQAVGCLGNGQVRTPNIDALTSTPTAAVAGSPLCTPFRGSLLTGRWPHRCVPGHDAAMPDGLLTVAHAFTANGYRTAYFGKWHVDGAANRAPGERPGFQTVSPERRGGFDFWLGYENNNTQYDCWVHGHDEDGAEIERFRLPGYETDELTSLFINYLQRHIRPTGNATHPGAAEGGREPPRPLFAVLSVQPPHPPYIAPERFTTRTAEDIVLRPNVPPVDRVRDRARQDLTGYYAMIEDLDWNVGRISHTLRETGRAHDTLIVFFSDHGDMLGSHGRRLKCVPYEESIRIPFIVGSAAASRRPRLCSEGYSGLINHVDIPVTTLGLCGLDAPEWMSGTDWSGHWRMDRPLPEPLPDSAFLQLVDPGWTHGFAVDRERPWRGIVTADGWKYAVLEGQPWLMFNLREDPYETTNLALDGAFSHVRRRLQNRLERWIRETGDAFRLPDVPVHGGKGRRSM